MSKRAFTFLVNPLSGGGAGPQAAAPVVEGLRAAGAEVAVCTSTSPEAAAAPLAAAVARADVIVSVGGDGMLSSVVSEVSRRGGTLGIIPAGRGNDFARMLGLPLEPSAQTDLLLHGAPTPVDVLSFALDCGPRRLVAGSVYAGVDAIASEIVDKVRWLPHALQYPWAAVRALATYRPLAATVVVDGVAHDFRAATVVVANSAYYGSGMKIAPAASVEDGLLDVVVIEAASRRALIRSLPKVYDGSHVGLDEVHVLRGRVVEITGTPAAPIGGDGEPLGTLSGTARVEVLPGALNLIGG